ALVHRGRHVRPRRYSCPGELSQRQLERRRLAREIDNPPPAARGSSASALSPLAIAPAQRPKRLRAAALRRAELQRRFSGRRSFELSSLLLCVCCFNPVILNLYPEPIPFLPASTN